MKRRVIALHLSRVAIGVGILIAAVIFCSKLRAQGQQPALQITSPADGTVVHPGQSVTVTVAPEPGTSPQYHVIP